MDWFAPVAKHFIAPLWAIKERTPYLRHLKELKQAQFYSKAHSDSIQLEKLKKILVHAYETVPYYKDVFKSVNAKPGDFKTIEDLSQLPVLTKDNIRDNQSRLISKEYSKNNLILKKTSGSTGVSLEVYVNEESLQFKRAVAALRDSWAGWDLGKRVAAIWGNPDHYVNWRMRLRNILLDRFTYLDTLKMDDAEMSSFFKEIHKKPPAVVFGHAHSIYLFAKFLKIKGWKPPQPKGIISTAMILHNHERELIEEVFSARVFNRYGCEEVSLIASESEEHNGLHMNTDNLVIEIVKDQKHVSPGEPGAIIVTDLTNYGMPLIRYKVGDVGILAEKRDKSNRPYPLFESIEGRAADYVITPEGKYISGISLTENFAMKLKDIKQLQIIQDKIDHLRLKIVESNYSNEQLKNKIQTLVSERFGPSMKFDIEYVESIQQEASGKYRFCISEIDNPFR